MVEKFTSELLLGRLQQFALKCLRLVKRLPTTPENREYGNQLIRSSSSPGANYIEAIEAGSKREFIHRLRICRKETKESLYWIDLLQVANGKLIEGYSGVKKEANELIRIFTSSIITAEKNKEMNK